MRIFDENKTAELNESEVDLSLGYKIDDFLNYEKNGQMIKENIKVYIPYSENEIKDSLRFQRQKECFEIINRGAVYWNKIWDQCDSETVILRNQELKNWYEQWLDITVTKNIPIKPFWIV